MGARVCLNTRICLQHRWVATGCFDIHFAKEGSKRVICYTDVLTLRIVERQGNAGNSSCGRLLLEEWCSQAVRYHNMVTQMQRELFW